MSGEGDKGNMKEVTDRSEIAFPPLSLCSARLNFGKFGRTKRAEKIDGWKEAALPDDKFIVPCSLAGLPGLDSILFTRLFWKIILRVFLACNATNLLRSTNLTNPLRCTDATVLATFILLSSGEEW